MLEQAGGVLPGTWKVWEKLAAKWLPLLCLEWGMHYSHPALPSSCNLTCPPGRYGANCAEVCGCHDGACDPLTGACHMGECQALGLGSATGWALPHAGLGLSHGSALQRPTRGWG